MKYYYHIYGLHIRSEVKLEEAYEMGEGSYDVDIQFGSIPMDIMVNRNSEETRCLISNDYKWFLFEPIGEFYITEGKLILIEAKNMIDERLLRSIILGPCFGSILFQRNILAIHGSAMVWDDAAIIISGESGAGKSTISTALRKQGWLFLADDTVAITSENGNLYANPAYPQQKLCLDTAIHFGLDMDQLIMVNEERRKYAVNVQEEFCSSRKEIKAMICLELNDQDHLEIEEVKGNAKLECIVNNLYAYYDFKYMGMSTYDFQKCMELTNKIRILKVKRPPNRKTQEQIIDHIYKCMEITYCITKAE